MTTESVFADVKQERLSQDAKWGVQDHQFPLWLTILTEELGEASQEHLKRYFGKLNNGKEFREELVQCAAVLIAMIESGDRNGWFIDPTF